MSVAIIYMCGTLYEGYEITHGKGSDRRSVANRPTCTCML